MPNMATMANEGLIKSQSLPETSEAKLRLR